MKLHLLSFVFTLTLASCLTLFAANSYGYELTGIPQRPTCDLCGKCEDASGLEQKPPDWESCRKCLYAQPDPLNQEARPEPNKIWTPIGCVSFDGNHPTGFIQVVLRFVTGIAGGLAFLGFLWGGFQLITSTGDPGRVNAGRGMILASIGAFLLILFSVFLLRFIGVDILGLQGFS